MYRAILVATLSALWLIAIDAVLVTPPLSGSAQAEPRPTTVKSSKSNTSDRTTTVKSSKSNTSDRKGANTGSPGLGFPGGRGY